MGDILNFDQYKVTNGHVRWKKAGVLGLVSELGCTGSLSVEPEIKEVIKMCEGIEEATFSKPTKLTGTLVGHMPVAVLREVYGLSTTDLEVGVYGYGSTSIGGGLGC